MKRRSTFARKLERRRKDPRGRRWLFVAYDQLSDGFGPLSREDPRELGIVLVESSAKASRRPYHKQKLALVLANLRHFALEQAERGVAVKHVVSPGSYGDALGSLIDELGADAPVRVMTPAERELRADLGPLIRSGGLREIPHEGWLTTQDQFDRSQKGVPWRMDRFYRLVRRETGILMRDGKPEGGKLSFDAENRKPWTGRPPAPDPPRFKSDPVKEEVVALVEERFGDHPGRLSREALPATPADARKLWSWARRRCLPQFGPYEDAMSTRSSGLFHTRLSALMNLHRLLPRDVLDGVLQLDIPLASKEGFVRQVLGWREFVRHVHVRTDGFRDLPGGGKPEFLGPGRELPPAFWDAGSGLACLDRVVRDVWEEGYSHHITRLMVLSNLATLLDCSPRELTDWFWTAYTDAYDWVVEPNVLGMGTFAVGDLMTTKPYVSGAAYIDRMSDYCGECAFDPRRTCPITPLYWAFLSRHARRLGRNPRMRIVMNARKRRDPSQRRRDRAVFDSVRAALERGERLEPGPPAPRKRKRGTGRRTREV
jgi:deoxyribodipyrimidine photolyase-related protein